MPKENNKMQVDIENLFKQNVNDLSSIKEHYRKLKELEEKITQIKYIDSNLVNKLKKEYENLKKIILDENVQAKLSNDIETIKSELDKIETKLQFVSYDMFNPKCDGISDDGIQIKACHDYANEHNIPVKNTGGKYYIKDTRNIEIKTLVDWGLTEFEIDETNNSASSTFIVKSKLDSYNMNSIDINNLKPYIKPNTSYIDLAFIKKYNNCLIVIEDRNKVVCMREHEGGTGNSKTLKEFFYIANNNIVGDINYNFEELNAEITSCKVYPCDKDYLLITGGKFFLSGNNNYNYSGAVVKCERSRVIIRDNFNDVREDKSTKPRNGFFNFENCYDVKLDNVTSNPNKTVDNGTYKIVANTVINIKFDNITCSDMGNDSWGCIETSYVKDVYYNNCNLNRIDTHWYICNLTVRDCKIGSRSINICGFGTALFDNVTRYGGTAFITPRGDYGGLWSGDIIIRDCKFIIDKTETRNSFFVLLHSSKSNYDYKLQSVIADNIIIDNFNFISEDGDESKDFCLIGLSNTIGYTGGETNKKNIIFPSNIYVKNVYVKGRSNGISELIRGLFNPQSFYCRKKGNYSFVNKQVETNANMYFEHIQCKKHEKNPNAPSNFADTSKYVATLSIQGKGDDYVENSLKPKVTIKNCSEIVIMPFASEGIFIIEDCTINHFDSYYSPNSANQKGRVNFDRCVFKADTIDLGTPPFRFRSELGTFLTNCFIDVPVVNGAEDVTGWRKLGFCDGTGWQLRGIYNNVTVSNRFTTNAPNINVKKALMHTEYVPSDDYLNYIPVRVTYGPTTSRPDTKYLVGGDTYFDDTLGKQITWSGSVWKDSATGNPVK